MRVVKINLNDDWLNIIRQDLIDWDYDISGLTDEKLSILYFTLQKKLIQQRPRKILKSSTFNCPRELILGLESLENKISKGEDLIPHLTRKLKNLDDNDGLLYDWGIFHLHLGIQIESDGFVERTGPLLYARFDNENAYFINVFSHGAWTMQEMLRIIHKNWPESIDSYRIKGIIGVEKTFNDNEIKHLRGAQINTAIEVEPGIVYIGPGGGIAASGDSMESVMRHLDRVRGLEKLEKSIKENTQSLLGSLFESLDFIKNPDLEFSLIRTNGKFRVYEKNNDFTILLNN